MSARAAVRDCEQRGISAWPFIPDSNRGLQIGPKRWVAKELQPVRFDADRRFSRPKTRTPTSAPSSRTRGWRHEASTVAFSADQSSYLQRREIGFEAAFDDGDGFAAMWFNQLPMEFAAEADKLLALKLEGSVAERPSLGSPALTLSFLLPPKRGLSRSSFPVPRDQSRRRPAALSIVDLPCPRGGTNLSSTGSEPDDQAGEDPRCMGRNATAKSTLSKVLAGPTPPYTVTADIGPRRGQICLELRSRASRPDRVVPWFPVSH